MRIVGGGDVAATDALYLANFAASVTIIHRRNALRAEKMLQAQLLSHPKIKFMWDSEVSEVLGTDEVGVTGLKVRATQDGSIQEVQTSALFVAIGHYPNTKIFAGLLDMDEHQYIATKPNSTATSRAGIFAAGDVQDNVFRQAITSAGSGCMAAMETERYLSLQESPWI